MLHSAAVIIQMLAGGKHTKAHARSGEERRQNRYGMMPIHFRCSQIIARIPLPPQFANWGTFPSGEGVGGIYYISSIVPHLGKIRNRKDVKFLGGTSYFGKTVI